MTLFCAGGAGLPYTMWIALEDTLSEPDTFFLHEGSTLRFMKHNSYGGNRIEMLKLLNLCIGNRMFWGEEGFLPTSYGHTVTPTRDARTTPKPCGAGHRALQD